MVVIERDAAGTPTVWCDPEIVDLVTALNTNGLRTVASCSGHGERFGNIALADGRELLVAPNFEEARAAERRLFAAPEGAQRKIVTIHRSIATGRIVGKHYAKTHPKAITSQQVPAPVPPSQDAEGAQAVNALTPAEVNSLPERVRRYVMWLETNADPAGTLQDNFRLTEENAALRALISEDT